MPRRFTLATCVLFCLATWTGATRFASGAGDPVVTITSLLGEMVDRDAIAQWPTPAYTCKQVSSYDRARTGPDNPQTWFSNHDYDYFIRMEAKAGRKEYVIMDVTGPGCLTRWWAPLEQTKPANQMVRIYLDGDDKPVIEATYYPFISGLAFVKPPFAFIASDEKDAPSQIGLPAGYKQMGADLYLPIPFARGCKITLDQMPFYYGINYRKYTPGTNVKSFTMADYEAAGAALKHAAQRLNDLKDAADGNQQRKEGIVAPGAELAIDLPAGARAVRTLQVQIDQRDAPQALRLAVLDAAFDGEAAVGCPLGEFFGCGARLNPLQDWCRSVEKDGILTSRWVMPYGKSARVAIKNEGKKSVLIKLAVWTSPWRWDDRSMHFHANWHCQYPINTRPMSDWNYIRIQGRGVYAGDTLTVFNPVPGWYGEGDEKIYIDGEKFPSHIGTGTEDYYGYAWGMAHQFNSPFISMPLRDSKGKGDWSGYTTTSRLRLLDGIPLQSSLKMDMEVWHWADTKVGYAAGTFWYGLPGAASNRGPAADEAGQGLPPWPPAPAATFPGAIECENLKVVAATSALPIVRQQLAGVLPGEWSSGAHLFVQAAKSGDFVELLVAQGIVGPCRITLHVTKSYDYGIIQFSINGKAAPKQFDGFQEKSQPSGPIDLGVFEPKDGRFVLRVEVVGRNPASKSPKRFFGLDCVVLSPP